MSRFSHAFSLPKSEVKHATPLGTICVSEQAHHASTYENIKSPEPSNDPADPLNWPTWRKFAVLACMSLYAFLANFTSGSIASAFPLLATPMAFNPPVPMDKLSQLVAVNVLLLGAANLLWVPLANAMGRRPVLLIGLLMLTLSSVWAGLSNSYTSLLAARAFMGVGGAPADTIAPKVVGEIFFVHQSGRAMGVYTLFLAISPSIGGVCGGYIASRMGLDWIQWINVILSAIILVLCLLLVPETRFERHQTPSTNYVGEKVDTPAEEVEEVNTAEASVNFPPFTYRRSLGFHRPKLSPLGKILVPFQTLRLPGVWLVMFWYAGLVGGVVTISTMGPQYVASPPYLWGENAGLINVGGIIGALLGLVMTSFFADRVMKPRGVSNSMYLEPESRLPVAFPGLLMGTFGLWVFGFCAEHPSPNAWVGLQVGIGMVSFAIMLVPSIGFNYLIESYGSVVADCFTMVTLFRSIISFSWTFFVGTWAKSAGPAVPFGVFGGIMGFFSILVIPVWLWGKRLRIATENWVLVK